MERWINSSIRWGCRNISIPVHCQASQVAPVVKNLPANAGDIRDKGDIPGLGEGHGNPLKYSCLENLMDRGAWWTTVHRLQRVRHD